MAIAIPEVFEFSVRLPVAERKVLIFFGLFHVVFDLLPPLGDELHHLLGIQMRVALLLADLLALFLTEEYVRGKRFPWRLHPCQNALFFSFDVQRDEVSEFSVPLLALRALLKELDVLRVATLWLQGRQQLLFFSGVDLTKV